jgi:catechol 2,3-dioxygenase-like lactoylglutathione lyase family enzyme
MKILDVEILSPDAARAVDFFESVLGLPVAHGAVRVGSSRLHFAAGVPSAPYHLAINIPANQVRAAKDWLERRASMLSDDIFDFAFWDAEAVYFEDPDANVLELIGRRGLQNGRAGSFGPEMLLGLSEVGLPVADTRQAIELLERTFGLSVFSGDRDQFTALGDDNGLFIVVRPGRLWLPTERACAENHVHVTIEGRAEADGVIGSSFRLTQVVGDSSG